MDWIYHLRNLERESEPGIERNHEEPDQEEGSKSISDYQSMKNEELIEELNTIRSSLDTLIEMGAESKMVLIY